MEAARASETLVSYYNTNLHRCENLKPRVRNMGCNSGPQKMAQLPNLQFISATAEGSVPAVTFHDLEMSDDQQKPRCNTSRLFFVGEP